MCEWDAFGGIPVGLGGKSVHDMTTNLYGGIFVAGEIDMAGDQLVNNIVMWDGSAWHDLDGGVNGPVYDIEMDSTSFPYKLLVAGDFDLAGGIPANNVAVWDGNQWSSLGVGSDNGVNGVARAIDYSYNCFYYVGGQFDQAGTTQANNIAAWDGSNWNSLSSGLTGGFVPYVQSISVLNNIDCTGNSLYVGGRFSTAGGVPCNNVAFYDGTNWSPVGTALNNGVNNIVFDVEYTYLNFSANLYVAGAFNQAGGIQASRLAVWDGNNWSALGNLTTGFVLDIERSRQDGLMMGGEYDQIGGISANNVVLYDGSSWSSLGIGVENGTNGRVNAVHENYEDFQTKYFGGTFGAAGTSTASQIAFWEETQSGSSWNNMSSGNGLGVNVEIKEFAHDSQGNLYAVGNINNAGGVTAHNIAQWDGTQWNALSDDEFDFDINDIVIDSNDNIYISGNFTRINGVVYNRIAKWDGTSWLTLNNGTFSGQIYDIAVDINDNLIAVGSFTDMGSVPAKRIAMWDGNNWNTIGNGVNEGLDGTAYAITVDDDGILYVGGEFSMAGTINSKNIASWDGSSWSSLTTGTNARVSALTSDDNTLYVGGRFTTAGGMTVNQIATWDGSIWINMENGITASNIIAPEIYNISVGQNGHVYAVGNFIAMSNLYAPRVARWDGVDWQNMMGDCSQPFGDMDHVLDCHVTADNVLYVGGSFNEVDSQISRGISRYDLDDLPMALCKDITIALDENGSNTINASDINDGSFAPCGLQNPMIINLTSNLLTCNDIGQQSYTLVIGGFDCNNSFCKSLVTVTDPFGSCCPDTLYAQGNPLEDGIYQAIQTVYSNHIVPSTGDISFQAENSVCLDPGFEVSIEAVFEALIEDCQ